MAELFEAGTLQRLSELELGPPCYTEDIAHLTEKASFDVEYAYVATNALGNFSGREDKEHIPNTFKEVITLPQAARWKVASDKDIVSLEKHGVYELVPIISVRTDEKSSAPAGHTGSRQTEYTRADWSCWGGHKFPESTAAAPLSPGAGSRASGWYLQSPWSWSDENKLFSASNSQQGFCLLVVRQLIQDAFRRKARGK